MLLAVIPPPHYGPLLREQTGPGPAATRPWGWPCTAPVIAVLGYQLPFPDRHSPRGEEVGQGTRCSPPPGVCPVPVPRCPPVRTPRPGAGSARHFRLRPSGKARRVCKSSPHAKVMYMNP